MADSEKRYTTHVCTTAEESALHKALKALRAGKSVVFPTDTVYGVGSDLWQPEAIERLYRAKRRPKQMPIPVLVSAPKYTYEVARDIPLSFEEVVDQFWPGGLTLILPRQSAVPSILCAGGDTIAVRMPAHLWALELIEKAGGALAVTSANVSGHPAATTAQEALNDLKGRVSLVIDGGECPGGMASTIVDLTENPPIILRAGPLGLCDLQEVLPRVRLCQVS